MTFKRILNTQEEITHSLIQKSCKDFDAHVFPKIRMADILKIEGSGISNDLYSFALQAHFDFIITDKNLMPLFAVEFDGPTHRNTSQQIRDQKKNILCEYLNLPILRINANYLADKYRGMDILSWLIEVWFIQKIFLEAQENGEIPPDEPFIAGNWNIIGKGSGTFPLWLSLDCREQIRNLSDAGKIKDPTPSCYVGNDKEDNQHAFAYIQLNEKVGLFSRTGMRRQNFEIPLYELLEDIAILELSSKLEKYFKGNETPIENTVINKMIRQFRNEYSLIMSSEIIRDPMKQCRYF